MKYYKASLSRNQGRSGWSVIFRHPTRVDPSTGKLGRRVRRGLGTADEAVAKELTDQLNELLRTQSLWEPSAREVANGRFDPRVLDIFYDGLESTRTDFPRLREDLIPLPSSGDGYRTVLLLGTTGAGKTTVVRQILGTDPRSERFPSTSTAKTTVADTELVTTSDGRYRAAVTFTPRDEVIDLLAENVSAAGLAAFRGEGDKEVARRMLDHVNQRFRLSYVLGRTSALDSDVSDEDLDDDDFDDDSDGVSLEDYGDIDVRASAQLVIESVRKLRIVVEQRAESVRREFRDADDDQRVVAELIEEALDTELRQTEEFYRIVDVLVDEIEKRFEALDTGELKRSRQGWPTTWFWETGDRRLFIRAITRFSSNQAPLFGRLLTPLVNGIRVSGPFVPKWADDEVRLVLIDGEGLGHTPKSATTLSTHVARRVDEVDAVLLVDNAVQPMQAAPVAALKSIAVSGNGAKLHFLFTHFDQVSGPNLPTFTAKEEHILASLENVMKAIGDELGPAAERILRKRMIDARFFVGAIQDPLDEGKKAGRRTVNAFNSLLRLLAHPELASSAGPSRPVYNRMNLSLAVMEAAKAFHARWRGLLGIEPNADVPREHWTRVKALTRRLAEGSADEYESLRPVADLRNQLQIQIYLMLQRPVRWDGGAPTDDERQTTVDAASNAVTKRLVALASRRLATDVQLGWQQAYSLRGTGSTFTRAQLLASEVYDKGAPIPTVAAAPDQNRFLNEVAALVEEVADELGIVLE